MVTGNNETFIIRTEPDDPCVIEEVKEPVEGHLRWDAEKRKLYELQNTKALWLRIYRATGGDIFKAAEVCNRHWTIHHLWAKRDKIFEAAYEAARVELKEALKDRVDGLAVKAVDAVEMIVQDKADNTNRLKAASKVLESVGIFSDKSKVEVSGPVVVKIVHEQMGK